MEMRKHMDDLRKAQRLGVALTMVQEVQDELEAEGYPVDTERLEKAGALIGKVQDACMSAWGTEVPQ